jgi:NTP pyrophosphatase (non-canonical NTP hydrolase)
MTRTVLTDPDFIKLRDLALEAIRMEYDKAVSDWPPYASAHEGYGVLAEEVAELFDAVRLKQSHPLRSMKLRKEAIQVAAVALRIALECDGTK